MRVEAIGKGETNASTILELLRIPFGMGTLIEIFGKRKRMGGRLHWSTIATGVGEVTNHYRTPSLPNEYRIPPIRPPPKRISHATLWRAIIKQLSTPYRPPNTSPSEGMLDCEL